MKILFLDCETTDQTKDEKRNPSPYLPANKLVSVGVIADTIEYYFFNHKDFTGNSANSFKRIQELLDWCDCICAYNAKFDLSWLLECGFKIDPSKKLYDPMLTEYILARGRKLPLKLDDCCARRGLGRKATNIQKYWDAGLTFYEMPLEEVEQYGCQDVIILKELYEAQQKVLAEPENAGLLPTIHMSCEFVWNLIDAERNGIFINEQALRDVTDEYTKEYSELRVDLERLASGVLGDSSFNLSSPEQLSQIIYSRKVVNKHLWAELFNLGMELRGSVMKPKRRPRMSSKEFIDAVRGHTLITRRTEAHHCEKCSGGGLVNKKRIDGSPFKKPSKCPDCSGAGYVLVDLPQVAGFKCSPTNPDDVTAGGFATDGDTLERLASRLEDGTAAKEFLTKILRYSAVSVYLNTFCGGIRRGLGKDSIIHTQLMQCITSTGRLSSQAPNFHNQPRSATFPVRKVVVSRFEGGSIFEVDAAKLEYATAVFLAQDVVGMQDIENDVDAHTLTSKIITEAGQPINRQEAKSRTFRPLFGGSTGTPAEVAYNIFFKEKHYGITAWQERNKEAVLRTGKLITPSGREFVFPGTKRLPNGYVSNSTSICNYPVQSFATADIIPCLLIEMRRECVKQQLKSLLILSVHDSAVWDVYPGELDKVNELVNKVFYSLPSILLNRYDIKLNVPLGWESKNGINWLSMKEIYKDNGKKAILDGA